MGTKKSGFQFDPPAAKIFEKNGVKCMEVLLAKVASTDTTLVGDDRQRVPLGAQLAEGINCSGKQSVVLGAMGVTRILD